MYADRTGFSNLPTSASFADWSPCLRGCEYPQHFADAPCLRDATAGSVGSVAVEDLADGADAGFGEVGLHDGEELVRADRRVVRVHHVEANLRLAIPERGFERLPHRIGARRQRGIAGERGHDPEGVVPERVDLHRLAAP